MACTSCSTGKNGMPTGCGDKGHCSTGGCNKLNTFDWLTALDIDDPMESKYAEISFKNGARKSFFKMIDRHRYNSGDLVIVDAGNGGYDIGRVSMMGDLVKLQMKKKNFAEDRIAFDVLRKANERDIERMTEARSYEKPALVKARVISRTLGLDMKIGDVEYQADLKKATFFYTADGWVDFRELVKQYAKEFKVKIEMRQIGARQESARIGGIGSCGRELCCSTWLSDFKSVNTTAARYQNIAINQSKLSGQCGRLKCCLNYELDLYVDELEKYPSNVDVLKSKTGIANLIKIDIFKGLLFYSYEPEKGRNLVLPLNIEEVKRIKAMNERKEYPDAIVASEDLTAPPKEVENKYVDVTGEIELPSEKRRKKKKKPFNKFNKPDQNPNQSDNQNPKPVQPNTGQNQNRGPQQNRQNNPGNNTQNQNRGPRPNQNQGQRPPQPKKPQDENKTNQNAENKNTPPKDDNK